eukprot:s1811_g6.t1
MPTSLGVQVELRPRRLGHGSHLAEAEVASARCWHLQGHRVLVLTGEGEDQSSLTFDTHNIIFHLKGHHYNGEDA